MAETQAQVGDAASPLSDSSSEREKLSPEGNEGSAEGSELVAPADVWKTAGGITLSAIAFIAALDAYAAQPSNLVPLGAVLFTGASCISLFTPMSSDVPFRGLNAASLAATAIALYPNIPSILPASLLGISGAASLSNAVRVAALEPGQGKGLAQLFIAIPAAISIQFVAQEEGIDLFFFHPALVVLGSTLIVLATSLQLTGRRNWLHSSIATAGTLGIGAGAAVMVADTALSGSAHFSTLHSWFGLATVAGVTLQVFVALPTMWPGLKANERSCVDFHNVLGRVNIALMGLAIVTGFADAYGQQTTVAIMSIIICSGVVAVMITPLWKATNIHEISF